jgi:hypothetical protein
MTHLKSKYCCFYYFYYHHHCHHPHHSNSDTQFTFWFGWTCPITSVLCHSICRERILTTIIMKAVRFTACSANLSCAILKTVFVWYKCHIYPPSCLLSWIIRINILNTSLVIPVRATFPSCLVALFLVHKHTRRRAHMVKAWLLFFLSYITGSRFVTTFVAAICHLPFSRQSKRSRFIPLQNNRQASKTFLFLTDEARNISVDCKGG